MKHKHIDAIRVATVATPKVGLVYLLRKVFSEAGLPLVIRSEDVIATKTGWTASAKFVSSSRRQKVPIQIISDSMPPLETIRGFSWKFDHFDRLLILPPVD